MYSGCKKLLAVALRMGEIAVEEAEDGWLVVNTQPHKESYALENLERQGFTVYCPKVVKRVRHARRAFDAHRPLFPSYLFVNVASTQGRWRPVQSTFGVRTIVFQGEQPGLIPSTFVDGLRDREVDGVVIKPSQRLEVGQSVRVQGGPLDGMAGDILELREKDRVLVLLSLMGQAVKLHVEADRLRPREH